MKERIITGVIAGLAFILLIIIGGLPFTLFIMLLASIAMIELLRMKHISPYSIMGILSLLFMWVLLVPNQWIEPYIPHINRTELFLSFILIFLAITVISKNSYTFDEVGFVIISSVYVGFGFHFLIETRLAELGLWLVFFILFLIWATDTGAYFFGRAIGKRKLWPDISPKKTIEGSIGGIGCALAVGLIFNWLVPIFDSLFTVLLISIVVSIVGQLGDLVESALKRHYSVKDSGNILPGHGGILDRFDSLIFVMPILYLFHFI
ncbi:phosphatidate cytidylyltransferase [Anaerobacillus alkalilacustris]|uniref:Phosphatidate cytidylyltransferase n=1 Tax=Anaerobacillus alkalilacustris TaxID=393763 RepID=A0A1S2LKZ8_9BACI|nr:phosphatidate cytidylyltransferase [Anaerobacillus alkalilacustris]OIJ13131.1 phosphatidate cytidylyltransferase [Anaerobacillus alkalilacustris]